MEEDPADAIEDFICDCASDRLKSDSARYAIAFAILRLRNALSDVANQLYRIADHFEESEAE
jgi:hypothetical protein